MSDLNYKELFDLTSKIYRVGLNWSEWESILEHFASSVKNGKGTVTLRQKDTFEIDIDNFYLVKTWNLDQAALESYGAKYSKIDAWSCIEKENRAGQLCVFSEHLSKRNLLKTDFYTGWLKPNGISDAVSIQLFEAKNIVIVFKIFHDDSTEAFLNLCQDLEAVLPHLCLATQIHMKSLGITDQSEYKNHAAQLKKKYKFTPREVDVARTSVYLGTNKKIADELGINETTVKRHIASILKKMKLSQKDEITLKLICFIGPELESTPPT